MADAGAGGGRFADKVVVVTGGASGIGLAAVRRFLVDGARVVIGDRDQEALDRVGAELGPAAATVCCDVTVEAEVEALTQAAIDRFGGLDVAFANAGIGTNALIVDSDLAEWSRVIDVCLIGPFLTIKHAARRMGDGGAIVVTASLNAVQAGAGMSAYCAAKAGVTMLVEVAAMELGSRGIRVNAIGPGLVRTGLTDDMWLLPGLVQEYEENAPLARHAQPDEIAGLVTFLASDDSGFMTGSLHLIDGGAHTKRYPDIPALLSPPPSV